MWWHGEKGFWGPSPGGHRYQLTEDRASGLPECEAKCSAVGGTPACLSTHKENEYVAEQLRMNMRARINFVPFGGKDPSYWGRFGPGTFDALVSEDRKNITFIEEQENRQWAVWIGRYEKDAPECAGDGRLADACWAKCVSGEAPRAFTKWAPSMIEAGNEEGMFADIPLPQQPDDRSPKAPDSMHADFDVDYLPNTASCVILYPYENGTWNDLLCDYGWVSHLPFAGLFPCLCEEGEGDPEALKDFESLEQRSLEVFHHQRALVLGALFPWIAICWVIPILVHISVCRCRRARSRVDPKTPLVGQSSTVDSAQELDTLAPSGGLPRAPEFAEPDDGELLQKRISRVAESARRQRAFVGGFFMHCGWVVWILIFFGMGIGNLVSGTQTIAISAPLSPPPHSHACPLSTSTSTSTLTSTSTSTLTSWAPEAHRRVLAMGLDRHAAFRLTYGCAGPTVHRTPSRPSPHVSLSPRASDRTSINVMCGVNLFCMFLLLGMIGFVGVLITSMGFMSATGPFYSSIIGLTQFIRLLVIVCRSCCCEYVRNSPSKHSILQLSSHCGSVIPSVAGASTRAPKYDVGVSPDFPLCLRLDARDVGPLQPCARPRSA